MKYVMIFHANLNYAYLTEDNYEFVIRTAYEMTIDTMAEYFPNEKYVFEASGYTLEQIAKKTPAVLTKLKKAIEKGQCEFMGSPYAHPMLPNFPKEDGLWTLKFANEIYQKYLGFTPVSFWNPECGWRSYVANQVKDAGYKNLTGDFEAYSKSLKPDGTPQRPEIYEKEHSDEKVFYNFAFKYDLPGTEQAIHFPFNNLNGVEKNDLRVFLRTDRIAQYGVRYFMGMEGYTLDSYIDLVKKYSEQPKDEQEGALIIFADDAEYIGTNGWFRLKYQNKPDNVFEAVPDAQEKLIKLVRSCKALGGNFITFNQACQLKPIESPLNFDDDSAWHGAQASTWASTPMARLLRPWQDLVREKLKDAAIPNFLKKKAWYHLTNSYNSDGQWPPTLPHAPHIIHPFNYRYCFDNLLAAEQIIGGVDRNKLSVNPVDTIAEILTLQAKMIRDKAEGIITSTAPDKDLGKAKLAMELIKVCTNYSAIKGSKLLYPSDYETRANTLVEARRLVGGVIIESVDDSKSYNKQKKCE